MQKSKLGIPVGLLGALIYFVSVFSGYTCLLLLGGYILLFEQDSWLKKTTVKAFALMVIFSLLSTFIGFVPAILQIIDNVFQVFDGTLYISPVYALLSALISIIDMVKKVLFIILGIHALSCKTVSLSEVDKIADKAIDD